MSDLDTSAYTPAHETGEENTFTIDSRYNVPLDQGRKKKILNRLNDIEEELRPEEETSLHNQIQRLKNIVENRDLRKSVKIYIYKCDRCNEIFDTKQGIGVHQRMNRNCNGADQPWNQEKATYTRKTVDEYERNQEN